MKMLAKLFGLSMICLSLTQTLTFAGTRDIGEKGSRIFVDIRKSGKYLMFYKCDHLIKDRCDLLGSKGRYTINEITEQRSTEKAQIYYSVGADIILGVATLLTAGVATVGVTSFAVEVSVVAAVAAEGVAMMTTSLNPYRQYKQYDVVNDDAINPDKMYFVSDIKQAIVDLENVLDKI